MGMTQSLMAVTDELAREFRDLPQAAVIWAVWASLRDDPDAEPAGVARASRRRLLVLRKAGAVKPSRPPCP